MNKVLSRISWVDVCRGIGILLVLYGHAIDGERNRFIIYAFHMPLFFFLSGIVFKPSHDKPFLSIVYKNFKQILIPYFMFAILTYALDMYLMHPDGASNESIRKQLYGIFYGNGNLGYLAFNVALWFLPCLFAAKVSLAFLTRFVKSKRYIIAILFLVSLIGYGFSVFYHDVKLIFGIESALTAFVFVGAGYFWNQSVFLKNLFTTRKVLILFVASAATVLFAWLNFQLYGHQIDMRLNRLNNYFLFYAGALSGISVCLSAAMLINKNTLLEYLGKHSLLLFVWHTVIFAYLRSHHIPPIKIAIINPTLYIIVAASIILFLRLLVEKIKFAAINKRLV